MKKKILSLLVSLLAIVFVFSIPLQAKENMIPNYEIKFLLDSDKILDNNHKLKESYKKTLYTENNYETIGVEYIETQAFDFSNESWINRIRSKDDKDEFDLTFKKRYPILRENISKALSKANEEGFDISDTNYEAQVEWGYEKMTLSLSNNKKFDKGEYKNIELPKRKEAIKMIKNKMPGKEVNWLYENWGIDALENGKKCGPIYYKKYKGQIGGTEVDIEIWPLNDAKTGTVSYISELSFKEKSFEKASQTRNNLMKYLEDIKILKHEDSLKTEKILKSFLK